MRWISFLHYLNKYRKFFVCFLLVFIFFGYHYCHGIIFHYMQCLVLPKLFSPLFSSRYLNYTCFTYILISLMCKFSTSFSFITYMYGRCYYVILLVKRFCVVVGFLSELNWIFLHTLTTINSQLILIRK